MQTREVCLDRIWPVDCIAYPCVGRANAACILACYMVLIQEWPPHVALAPISQMDPPLMPFRDAGYSQADYSLTVQDVVYGVWRAKQEGICGLKDFNLEEYERYERVDNGDFNWITPNFVAFASPQHLPVEKLNPKSQEYASLPRSTAAILDSKLPAPFKHVLAHFRRRKVGLVVRLNSELYSPSYFAALGMTHMDMIFDDGTCPSLKLVRKFVGLAHNMINVEQRGIAVHCKAGLGRTGCLIGAYLIYRHGFTANEVIAYMRFMRPGMVVGPQQHWLHLNQGTFREWWFEDSMRDKIALMKQSTPPRVAHRASRVASNGQTFTPPVNSSQKRRALGELDDYNERQSTNNSMIQDENLPAPTPGQPRKTSKLYGERHNPYTDNENDEPSVQPDTEIISVERHLHPDGDLSEEEYKLQMLAGTRSISRSPSNSHKKRAVSCMTTTTTMTSKEWTYPDATGDMSPLAQHRTPSSHHSGSGTGLINVGKRGSPVRRATDRSGGIRKTSGRVGSGPHVARVKG